MLRAISIALSCVAIITCSLVVHAAGAPFVAEDGFVSLFDGKSLTGWTGPPGSYVVEDGCLVCVMGQEGNLLTDKEFANFVLKFEFKLTAGADNGLGIRCPKLPEGHLHLEGTELQIIDDSAEKHKKLRPCQYHGSVYGVLPAKRGSLKPVGEWNQEEVTVNGRQLKIVVNGMTVVDANLDEASKPATIDKQPHPGLFRTKGHLALLGHGDRVDFRHLQVKELPLTATSDSLELVKQRLADKNAVLLDVREVTEWNNGHVDGAISLPISKLQEGLEAETLAKIVPKDKIIYTHCAAGGRALAAAEVLSRQGYDVRPLKPGIRELFGAGFAKGK
jgi:rhodanese-related sulfurtransferase